MRTLNLYILTATLLLFVACNHHYYKTNNAYNISTVNNNVCKKLNGKVLLYAIFVDTRQTRPWTDYDINTTLDSIRKAISWITGKAKNNNIPLSIELAFHVNKEKIPIEQHLYGESLSNMLFSPDGIDMIDLWANSIARKAGESFPTDTSFVVATKNVITNRERLIARLRDKYQTDNVVLMYFLNNYFTDEISLAMFAPSGTKTEFCIISFKYPAVIAHEFLHVFGALDLYMSPFEKKKKAVKNRAKIMKVYPNEIMAYAYRSIEKLDISPISKYLIGWKDSLADSDRKLLVGKKLKIYKY
jgi:hypothetical protein